MTAVSAASSNQSKSSSRTEDGTDRLVLWVTYVNIVLYALCYQLQSPVEPFLIKSLTENSGANEAGAQAAVVSQTYGQLQSFFSTIQTIGSPLVGMLLDRIGIRYASAIVFLSSAMSYGILANAKDLNLLFWSKVPTALQHAFLVAQAAAAASTGTNAAARAQALGRMTTAYTIGATVGPALGGYMAQHHGDFYISARWAVVGSLISVVLSLWFLPNHQRQQSPSQPGGNGSTVGGNNGSPAPESKAKPPSSSSSIESFKNALNHSIQMALRPTLWPLLVVKVVGGMAASMYSTSLPLVLTQPPLELKPSQLGLSMSASMFAVAGFGAVAMAPLTELLGSFGMAQVGLLGRSVLALVMAMMITTTIAAATADGGGIATIFVIPLVVTSVLHSLSSHVLATGLTTQTTGSVDKDEQGTLLGLEHGLFSLARIVGPTLGTNLLLAGSTVAMMGTGFWSVAIACGMIDVALVACLRLVPPTKPNKAKD